jgi:arginyl-tRNA synthetase
MSVPFHIASSLEAALQAAAASAGFDASTFAPEVRPADPKHGDYQANGVLGYAKRQGQNPRTLAEKLVAALPAAVGGGFMVSIAGPGFINFTLKPATAQAWLGAFATRAQLAAAAAAGYVGQTWVLDYSSPNTAKQMHVGHLRSAVIGEALGRLLAFAGARVIRDNHLGDWGTQFGKLIYGYKRYLEAAALQREPIEELERLYKLGNAETPDGSPALEAAKRELVQLQNGDPENVALWKSFSEISLAAFQTIYDRLGIKFDHALGESFYNDQVERVYQELQDTGLAVLSEGALVVFHPEHPRFAQQPFLVRKADGASNYASTDLATVLYRAEHFRADGVVIVTDFRQNDHFEQLFLTARKWFAATGRRLPRLEHVSFGAVTGSDGKALKTRDGGTIKLKDLLDEAETRAAALVAEKNPDLPPAERADIAKVVGVGAVQYADLSQNRSSNYVFAWEKMLALEGNTAPYLLYAVARLHSIFRKLGATPGDAATEHAADELSAPTEIALARVLTKFPDALSLATSQLRPHFLCLYLYELAGQFSSFYAAEQVTVAEPAVRARRTLLCARTLLTLETGLDLLGLRTLTRM